MGKKKKPVARRDTDALLDEVWASLPPMDCRGLCFDSCGPIRMTTPERQRVRAAGVDIPDGTYNNGPSLCPALTMLNRCAVYADRPTICRIYGMTRTLKCQYGCEPEGGFLSDAQAYEVLARVFEIAGDHQEARKCREPFAVDAAAADRILRRLALDQQLAYLQRRRRAEADGSAVYVIAAGQLSKQRPKGARW